MAKRPKRELKLSQAVAQPQSTSISISFKELLTESYKYTIRPKYQRERAWSLKAKQQFIDSLFMGDPVAPVEGYESSFDHGEHIGENKLEIGDGQNRTLTILEFMNDGFKTMTESQKINYDPSSQVGPIAPGKLFSELDQITRNYFLGYRLRIDVLRNRPEPEKSTRFLRVQNHVALTAAERLKVYASRAKEVASLIENHQFWSDFYIGKRGRGQIFQMSLYLLALEMTPGGIVDLQLGGYTQGLIYGNHDDEITDDIVNTILTRLDDVSHVYNGTIFTRRVAAIAMYQSVLFLNYAGHEITTKDKRKLSKWIDSILTETKHASGIPNYAQPIQALTSAKGQRIFWDKHLERILKLFGISEAA